MNGVIEFAANGRDVGIAYCEPVQNSKEQDVTG